MFSIDEIIDEKVVYYITGELIRKNNVKDKNFDDLIYAVKTNFTKNEFDEISINRTSYSYCGWFLCDNTIKKDDPVNNSTMTHIKNIPSDLVESFHHECFDKFIKFRQELADDKIRKRKFNKKLIFKYLENCYDLELKQKLQDYLSNSEKVDEINEKLNENTNIDIVQLREAVDGNTLEKKFDEGQKSFDNTSQVKSKQIITEKNAKKVDSTKSNNSFSNRDLDDWRQIMLKDFSTYVDQDYMKSYDVYQSLKKRVDNEKIEKFKNLAELKNLEISDD